MAMKLKKLAYTKPLFTKDTGLQVKLLKRFPNGNLGVEIVGKNRAVTVDAYGRDLMQGSGRIRIVNEPPVTVEYLSLYPDGNMYSKACCPVRTSSYDVENLIQIRVTRRGGKIIDKEFV